MPSAAIPVAAPHHAAHLAQALTDRLGPLKAQRVGLVEQLRLIESEAKPIKVRPNVMKMYHASVKELAGALAEDSLKEENHIAFRNLIPSLAWICFRVYDQPNNSVRQREFPSA